MKFEITNRHSGDAQYTCELPAGMADKPYAAQLGYAVLCAARSDADLSEANLRRAGLSRANLHGTGFRNADLRRANLCAATLSGADLCGADLRGANLRYSDLRGTNLSGADLRGADLRYVDIKIDNIHQTVYAAASQPGALSMSEWHSECGAAHCRAGWVIALAGDAGKWLESAMGTHAAAALIYMSNDPELERIPDFYCDAETALADMKRLAEMESARTAVC